MFEIPFDAIAAILGRSAAAAKMLASRARGRIRPGTPATAARPRLEALAHPALVDGVPGVVITMGGHDQALLAQVVLLGGRVTLFGCAMR